MRRHYPSTGDDLHETFCRIESCRRVARRRFRRLRMGFFQQRQILERQLQLGELQRRIPQRRGRTPDLHRDPPGPAPDDHRRRPRSGVRRDHQFPAFVERLRELEGPGRDGREPDREVEGRPCDASRQRHHHRFLRGEGRRRPDGWHAPGDCLRHEHGRQGRCLRRADDDGHADRPDFGYANRSALRRQHECDHFLSEHELAGCQHRELSGGNARGRRAPGRWVRCFVFPAADGPAGFCRCSAKTGRFCQTLAKSGNGLRKNLPMFGKIPLFLPMLGKSAGGRETGCPGKNRRRARHRHGDGGCRGGDSGPRAARAGSDFLGEGKTIQDLGKHGEICRFFLDLGREEGGGNGPGPGRGKTRMGGKAGEEGQSSGRTSGGERVPSRILAAASRARVWWGVVARYWRMRGRLAPWATRAARGSSGWRNSKIAVRPT